MGQLGRNTFNDWIGKYLNWCYWCFLQFFITFNDDIENIFKIKILIMNVIAKFRKTNWVLGKTTNLIMMHFMLLNTYI